MSELISEEYRRLNNVMHRTDTRFGHNGGKWADIIAGYIHRSKTATVLDYGTGKGTLVHELRARGYDCQGYDPAVMEWAGRPAPADFVICADVLEHIEPDRLDAVLADLAILTKRQALLIISLVPSDKDLPDGRNAHLIVEGEQWWRKRLATYFTLGEKVPHRRRNKVGRELAVLATPQ